MRLLVTGARGLLGTDVVDAATRLGVEVVPLGHAEVDVTDSRAVRDAISEHLEGAADPYVVHCAAYTAVDAAEADAPACFAVNEGGARVVARAAAEAGAGLVYFSTDYVFDGHRRRPYRPGDPTGPLCVYAQSKLAGEVAVAAGHPEPLIVRTGWLYGAGGPSFVTTILSKARGSGVVRVVDDQRGRPTWTRNVAESTLELMAKGVHGVFHVTDGDEATWLDVARYVLDTAGVTASVEPVSSEEWGAPARRPRYSVLDVSHTEDVLGRPSMPWRDALRRFVEEMS